MRKTLLLVWLLVHGTLATAQQLSVQTGEHTGFTRVVIRLAAGTDWQLDRADDGYLLSFTQPARHDLSDFFRLIPRRRITDVTQDQTTGTITFTLACACAAETFLVGTSYLVIDFSDGPPPAIIPATERVTPPSALPLLIPRPPAPPLLPLLRPAQAASPRVPPPELAPAPDGLAANVITSLSRGMSAGLLDPAFDTTDPPVAGDIARDDRSLPGLAISTDTFPPIRKPDAPTNATATGKSCPADALIDVNAWADDRPFTVQLAALRSQLVQEFDTPDLAISTQLARFYLHYGFGREAQHIADMHTPKAEAQTYISYLAKIIDRDLGPVPDLSAYFTCNSKITFWAFLAQPPGQIPATVDRIAIVRNFTDLPHGLQIHLGQSVIERLAALGATDDIAQIRTVMATDGTGTAVAADPAVSPDPAAISLSDQLNADRRLPVSDIVALVETALDRQAAIPPQDLTLLDSLQFEFADSPENTRLVTAQIRGHLQNSDFPAAWDILARAQDSLAPDIHLDLTKTILTTAITQMPDVDFLELYLSRNALFTDPALLAAAQSRIADMGFNPADLVRNAPPLPPIAAQNPPATPANAPTATAPSESPASAPQTAIEQARSLLQQSQQIRTLIDTAPVLN